MHFGKRGDGFIEKGLIIALILAILVLAAMTPQGQKVTGNIVRRIGCEQEMQYKSSTEEYISTAKNCDHIKECYCIHESWAGLGACDSCKCYRSVRIPVTVESCIWD